jgi:putative glutamine amidotransferase
MSAPLIGLPTYGRDERNRFTLFAEYVDGVRRAGGVPVLLPPGEERIERWLETIDGLILTGGGDLDPEVYRGTRGADFYEVDAERDATELALARHVAGTDLPALCICRGMQILNVALGGTLIEHLEDEVGDEVAHRLPPREPVRHPVAIDAGSLTAELSGAREIAPYSWHHQAIRDLAPGLSVVARAPDGVIEAVELDGRPELLAVQWHPELSAAEDTDQQRLFDALVRWAARREDSRPHGIPPCD